MTTAQKPIQYGLGPASTAADAIAGIDLSGQVDSPDSKTLALFSLGSNAVTEIDAATNAIKGKVYVGRSPHEPFFTPDGREWWVTMRGENYVSVIDPVQIKEIRRIELANGPGRKYFWPLGRRPDDHPGLSELGL